MSSQNENSQSDLQSFSYFISRNSSIIVATLAGLCEEDASELLEQCKNEIQTLIGESVKGVILNLSGLTGIANDLVPLWAQLQSMVRSQNVELRICGIEDTLKEKLLRMGIIRTTEHSPTLKEALPEIVTAVRKNSSNNPASTAQKKAA